MGFLFAQRPLLQKDPFSFLVARALRRSSHSTYGHGSPECWHAPRRRGRSEREGADGGVAGWAEEGNRLHRKPPRWCHRMVLVFTKALARAPTRALTRLTRVLTRALTRTQTSALVKALARAVAMATAEGLVAMFLFSVSAVSCGSDRRFHSGVPVRMVQHEELGLKLGPARSPGRPSQLWTCFEAPGHF